MTSPESTTATATGSDRPRVSEGFLILFLLLLGGGTFYAAAAFDARIAVGVFAAVLLLLLVLRSPYFGLLGYVVIIYLRPGEIGLVPEALHVERLAAVLLLLVFVLERLRGRGHAVPRDALNWVLIGLLGVMLAGVPFAFWKGGVTQAATEFAKLCFLYFALTYAVDSVRAARGVMWVAMLVWGWHALAAWRGYATGSLAMMGEAHTLRAMGPTSRFGGPDDLANLLVVALCFCVMLYQVERARGLRVVLVLLTIGCTGAAYLTGSRTGFLAVFAIALLFIWKSPRKLLGAAVMAVALSIALLLVPASMQQRYSTISSYSQEATWLARRHGWEIGRQMFLDHPLLGVGAGNFGAVRHQFYDQSWLEAHSVYWQVAAEMGLLGMVGFVALAVFILRGNRRARRLLDSLEETPDVAYARRLSHTLEAVLVLMLFLGITGHNFMNPNYYLVAGLTVALRQIAGKLAAAGAKAAPEVPVKQAELAPALEA